MTEREIWVFFYGSFMNQDVLKQTGYLPRRFEVAKLHGFDIRIEPLANLVPSEQHCVYGMLAAATHEELRRLYAQEWVGTYLPEAVLVETLDGRFRPALCYIAPVKVSQRAETGYVDRILMPARQLGFPEWYIARLSAFKLPRPSH